MLMSMLGSSGVGLVWGWLAGSIKDRMRRPNRNVLAISLTTLAISTQLLSVAHWQALLFFFGAAFFAFLIHVAWRRELRDRWAHQN